MFDKWWVTAEVPFEPGAEGGPAGDGTLHNAAGDIVPPEGHDYRLKNLFGWDLRGRAGIYGPDYQAKPHVLATDLLADTRTEAELVEWLRTGDEELPAFGAVMSDDDLEDVAAFIVKIRSGVLPRPEQIWTLSPTAPKNYTLRPGGDAVRGREIYETSCAGCHGERGEHITIDGTLSLGAFMRTKGYEGWFKVLNGQPGTDMMREIEFTSGEQGAQVILDLFAALCDRGRYPALAGQADVPDDDPRCGAYLSAS